MVRSSGGASNGRSIADTAGEGITRLEDLRWESSREFGGKAAGLGEAWAQGLPILPGVALDVHWYERALDSAGLASVVRDFWQRDPDLPPSDIQAMADRIRNALLASTEAQQAAQQAVACVPWIHQDLMLLVRSSGTAEDSAEASFAGQFESIRCTSEAADLAQAIARVWASSVDVRVRTYVARRRLSVSNSSMAVIVQPFRTFSVAGLLFTRHPLLRLNGWFLVEASDSPPDAIVGGEVTPHRFRLHESGVRALWETNGGQGLDLDVDDLAALGRFGSAMRERLGHDVDIEWGKVEGKVVLLQCRPVTTK